MGLGDLLRKKRKKKRVYSDRNYIYIDKVVTCGGGYKLITSE